MLHRDATPGHKEQAGRRRHFAPTQSVPGSLSERERESGEAEAGVSARRRRQPTRPSSGGRRATSQVLPVPVTCARMRRRTSCSRGARALGFLFLRICLFSCGWGFSGVWSSRSNPAVRTISGDLTRRWWEISFSSTRHLDFGCTSSTVDLLSSFVSGFVSIPPVI